MIITRNWGRDAHGKEGKGDPPKRSVEKIDLVMVFLIER